MLLFEVFSDDPDEERIRLIAKVRAAKQEVKDILSRGAGLAPGEVQPQFRAALDRARRSQAVAQAELDALANSVLASAKAVEFRKSYAETRAKETPSDKRSRWNTSISDGRHATEELRAQYGGWEGLAAVVYDYTYEASNAGSEKIIADDIAHEFGTTVRTVNKWLERPEFLRTTRLLGR